MAESVDVGIYSRSLPGAERLDGPGTLAAVRELGLSGCLFASPLAVSPTLDDLELDTFRARAADAGVALGVGIGRIHPHRPDAMADAVRLGDGNLNDGLRRLIRAGGRLGSRELWFSVGALADRLDPSLAWVVQLGGVEEALVALAPFLRAEGYRLNVKTHEEITTWECVRLVEAVGPDVLGIAFDPVNVLVRLENPVAAARRVAPYVRQVHVDDAILYFVDDGVERKLYPPSEGLMDWATIRQLSLEAAPDATYWIELHRGQFRTPVFERGWLAHEPDLAPAELAVVMGLAVQGDLRLRSGAIPPSEAYQAEPTRRLAPTLELVRSAAWRPA